MAPIGFSGCRHIVKKSKQVTSELDYKQEFFLDGPHTRQLAAALYGGHCTYNRPFDPTCREIRRYLQIFRLLLIFHGGRLVKFSSYDPTRAEHPFRITESHDIKYGALHFTNATAPFFSKRHYSVILFSDLSVMRIRIFAA